MNDFLNDELKQVERYYRAGERDGFTRGVKTSILTLQKLVEKRSHGSGFYGSMTHEELVKLLIEGLEEGLSDYLSRNP